MAFKISFQRIFVCLLLTIATSGAWAEEPEVVLDSLSRGWSEVECIAVLESSEDWYEKQLACRQLRVVGGLDSVPVLGQLLREPELANLAQVALEAMPYPEVDAVFRDALQDTEGLLLTGVLSSLGVRQDEAAVPLILPLLDSDDLDVAHAAAGALGRIGTVEAAEALLAHEGAATQPDRAVAVGEGLLAAGEVLRKNDERDKAEGIYQKILAGPWPSHIRMGALQGICDARPDSAPQRLLEAIQSDDPIFRDMAAQIISDGDRPEHTPVFAAALSEVSGPGQLALLRGLTGRRDQQARDAVLPLLTADDAALQQGAIRALGALGTPEDAGTLIGYMASDDEAVSSTARDSLRRLEGDAVNETMIDQMDGGSATLRAGLLTLLAERLAPQAVAVAAERVSNDASEVRLAALSILSVLGGASEAPELIAALNAAEDNRERNTILGALNVIGAREGGALLPLVLEALPEASGEAQSALLRTLPQIGNDAALAELVRWLEAEGEIAEEAVRVLGNWPHQNAAPHLLELAQAPDGRKRDTGLRGYIRLARGENNMERRIEMLHAATEIVESQREVWLVLGAWGTVNSVAALDIVRPYLENDETRDEAASAVVSIAQNIKDPDDATRTRLREALDQAVANAASDGVRERATEARTALD